MFEVADKICAVSEGAEEAFSELDVAIRYVCI